MINISRFSISPAFKTFAFRLLRSATAEGFTQTGPILLAPSASPEEFLSIPMADNSFEDDDRHDAQQYGQFLARQDRWEDLAQAIQGADEARETTRGGMPIADLLTYGARADVVRAAEHALMEGKSAKNRALLEGINGLEDIRREHPGVAGIALVLALAHVDIGWAWRGRGSNSTVSRQNREKFAAHFDRAEKILSPYRGAVSNSPVLAAAQCALLAGRSDPQTHTADSYENLIDLHPQNYRHMRAMGHHLLPRWFGSYDQLELEARRTAARTQKIWGNGAYTWVYFDAISLDDQACAQVDVEFFIDGLRDIVAARPDQEVINLLAAFCSVALHQRLGANDLADLARTQISDCAKWLIRDHLTEVHPLIWAHAAEGFDNNARITSVSRFAARGRADALQAIADQFRDEIHRGLRVTFTPDGPQLHPV